MDGGNGAAATTTTTTKLLTEAEFQELVGIVRSGRCVRVCICVCVYAMCGSFQQVHLIIHHNSTHSHSYTLTHPHHSEDQTRTLHLVNCYIEQKEEEKNGGHRCALITGTHLSQLLPFMLTLEGKKALIMRLSSNLSPDLNNYKSIVDLFQNPSDVRIICNFAVSK